MARVSILLTSYNHAQFLRQSIESILSQSFTDFELFIVDDGSADESREIIQTFHDERIHATFHEQNQGGPHWMRDIKPQMTGEYFAMAHCDDQWLPGKLEKQVAYLDAHPECGACFTDVQVIDEEGLPYQEKDGFYFGIFSQENRSRFDWLRRFFYEGNCLCHPSILIRMECYAQYGMDDEESLFSLPDYYQWVKLALHTELYIYPEKLACFRVRKHAGNTSGDKPDGHIRSAFEMFKLLSSYLELRDKPEDFLRVFPGAQQYVRNGRLFVEYAYARILLDESDKPVFNLLGLLILQNLLDNPQTCARLEQEYGYNKKSFAAESGSRDVFHTIGDEYFLTSALYWDTGAGFTGENFAARRTYCSTTGHFEILFSFPEPLRDVRRLRFDPDKDFFRMFRDVEMHLEGEHFSPIAQGAVQERQEGTCFYTTPPQYQLRFDRKREIHAVRITGITRKLTRAEIEQMLSSRGTPGNTDREQSSQLFWNTGEGFVEGQNTARQCPIDENGHFDILFRFPGRLTGVEELRIDLDKDIFREYRNLSIKIDGQPYMPTVYSPAEEQGNNILFCTPEPQLLIVFYAKRDITQVQVSGDTHRLSMGEVEQSTRARVRAAREEAQRTVEEMAKNLASARKEQLEERRVMQAKTEDVRQAMQKTIDSYQHEIDALRAYLKQHPLKASLKALLGKLWTD